MGKFMNSLYNISQYHGVVVNELYCDIVECEFELQSRYYVHYHTNTLGNGTTPPPVMGYCSITVLGWLWHEIIHEGWYAIKQRNQTYSQSHSIQWCWLLTFDELWEIVSLLICFWIKWHYFLTLLFTSPPIRKTCLFDVISRTLVEGVLPLCRDAVGVFYSPGRLLLVFCRSSFLFLFFLFFLFFFCSICECPLVRVEDFYNKIPTRRSPTRPCMGIFTALLIEI